MANWVTFGRFLLLFVLLGIIYSGVPVLQLVNAPLTVLIIALDGVDGWVARKYNEESLFGATFDIAIDRIVETVVEAIKRGDTAGAPADPAPADPAKTTDA